MKLVIATTDPIQYHAPLFRELARKLARDAAILEETLFVVVELADERTSESIEGEMTQQHFHSTARLCCNLID